MNINRQGDWLLIKPWLLDKIETDRAALEALITHEESVNLRGRIAVLRELIEAVEPGPQPEITVPTYE